MQLFSFICNVSINKSKWPFRILSDITGDYFSTSNFYIINEDTENIDLDISCFLLL